MLKKLERAIKKNNKKLVIIVLAIFLILLLLIGITSKIIQTINKKRAENLQEITYSVYKVNENNAEALVTFYNADGIEKITYKDYENDEDMIVNCYGKTKIAIDYKMQDLNRYEFKVVYKNNAEKTLAIDFEIPRTHGLYTLKNGIYVNEPDISTGLIKENTRYLYLNEDGNLTPSNWLVGNPPEDWYDYSNQKWANIVTIATDLNGNATETYYVWIPRYEYKILSDRTNLSTENRRIDVNFITTEITNENCSPGYKVPEAFWWDNNSNGVQDEGEQLTGYWISKYQLNTN